MKMKLWNRLIAFLLCIGLMITMIPSIALAEETIPTTEEEEVVTPDEGDVEEDNEADIYAEAVSVSTGEQLAEALADAARAIRITADFELDQTFYVTDNTAIFSEEAHTLTRAPGFGGDIFVVGESKDGVICEESVTLTLGLSESTEKDLLIIEGNRANMAVDVTGSVIFVVCGAGADLYENVTIRNHKKTGNEKTLTEVYGVSYAGRVGGAVAIITAKATMNIYGGTYSNNSANDITDSDTEEGQVSTHGGVIYNYGTLNVYGGTFEGNHAARGGVFYCYRTIRIYNAQLLNNTASTYGGAVYMPSSTAAFLFLGGENDYTDSRVVFEGNSAVNNGGAIYARNKLDIQDTQFLNNTSTAGSGGAIAAGEMELIVSNTVFDGNTAKKYGGAIYYVKANSKNDVTDLTCVDTVFKNSSVSASGGALYMNGDATAYMENVEFTANTATSNGGAAYLNSAHLDINGGTVTQNSSSASGGAFTGTAASSIRLNAITGSRNTAKYGGAIYCEAESTLYAYDSTFEENSATGKGGAVYMVTGANGGIYNTTFHKNTSGSEGGALYIYLDGYTYEGAKVVLHSCTYTENEGANGGAIYTAKQSTIDLYNSTAKNNTAKKGGFLYHTAIDTVVNLASLILEGNTATDGPIIYGNTYNAVLNLDKALYIDKDVTDGLDDAYWAAAIANKLTVNEVIIDIPNYIGYAGEEVVPVLPRIPVEVTTAAELEAALASGKDLLHITADFDIDRTFYIRRNTTIYTSEAHTLTRAADFAGDIFVVGEHSDGTACENDVTLTLGDPESETENLLIIDGNKDNTTVTVTGSVIFVVGGATAELHDNVTIRNHQKLGNEKTLTENYGVSYVERVGGAVAILSAKATMNIYGGTYANNAVGDVSNGDSSQGGVIYNFGTLNVYGGTFEGNYASRGAVVYCYRKTYIYNAVIRNNSVSGLGGAVYIPASTAAYLYLGGENEVAESNVVFEGNTADSNGGAIYAQHKLEIRDTQFIRNSSTSESGGAIAATAMEVIIRNTVFDGNTAQKYGGAIYFTGVSTDETAIELTCVDTVFQNNSVSASGGALYMNKSAEAQMKNVSFISNTASNNGGAMYLNAAHVEMSNATVSQNGDCANGGAFYLTTTAYLEMNGGTISGNTCSAAGGAIALDASSEAVLSKVTASGNQGKNGGFLYAAESSLTVYRSTIKDNTSTLNGGGIALYGDASANIYATEFVSNTTQGVGNGGGLFLYTNTAEVLVQDCLFSGNNANYGGAIYASNKTVATLYDLTATGNTAAKGGFLYETTTGTTLTLVGATVSGNTATDGGPIIWGNSTGAVLYLDKAQYTDLHYTGESDSTYWNSAIVNKLTVKDISAEIPKWLDYEEEAYDNMADAVDVSTVDQLEQAILSGATFIRVIADMEIDRTFYITGNTTIFSTLPRTLTRAADFGGDIFVVGEDKDGKSALLLGGNAKLVLGNPLSTRENLLTIDGNKDNMTVPVTGTALFICYSSAAELYTNVTAQNMHKTGNERTYNEAYGLSYANRVGGALAIVSTGSLTIHGGNYRDNLINEEDTSSEETRTSTTGGLIYNNSNLYIHGGTFENNQGARGGVIYNYKILRIDGGSFIGNVATLSGGVFYSPNAAYSHTYIGSTDGAQVLFQNNSSASLGGAINSSALCALVIYGNTTFEGNTAETHGGAICSYGQLTVRDTVFSGNTAQKMGGAVYMANSNENYVTRHTLFEGCTFENNLGTNGGALAIYSSNSEFENGAIVTVSDCAFTGNQAASPASKSTTSYGGAIYVERRSSLTVAGTSFNENTARTEGGAVYAGGASTVSFTDTVFDSNAILDNGKHGGAVAIHSVTLTADEVTFKGNAAVDNGGALYVSYASAYDRNSEVLLKNSTFSNNVTEGVGGAVYVTKQTVTEDKRILTVQNTDFTKNSSTKGGALYCVTGTTAYMTDTTFTKNEAVEGVGGAIYSFGAELELDTATFTKNTSTGSGAALFTENGAQTVLYAITASGNAAEGSGGFLYATESTVTLYDSVIKANTAVNNGGGLALYSGAAGTVYNTEFTENIAEANGGGVFFYTNETPCMLHSCTFTGNSGVYGGAIYASNKTVASLYALTATGNRAQRGGFLYETTTDTALTLVGTTVSGNTATAGGPVIWGNSVGAVLKLDKTQFTDLDQTGTLDAEYWSSAIINKLTVEEITASVPTYDAYKSNRESIVDTPVTKEPVSVQDVFSLAQNSSDANINAVYNSLPKLDNSSNFMSKNVTTYEDINGGTVTVDTFIYPNSGTADNCNVGMGLMIYQAMCYKQANPDEDVYIDMSYYRFSVQAAVNINRNSRYFGYMRQLSGSANYDKYGFVRIAYLVISAAKMGIHVTAIGHIDGYPTSADSLKLYDYFTTQLNDPCDPDYVQDAVIGDYLNFCQVDWTLGNKGGTDMMHTKMCAVSHYLDMNGVAHKNAVWSGSTNLDGITSKAMNANSKIQTATIVSDHEEIYRTAVNYLRLIPQYQEQEEIYEFQDLVNRRSTEQGQLFLEGRQNEIPSDEQIIYLGSENDPVFELYFTPMGGDILAWDEVYNPYCKYMRKLYDSEDYILFSWNAAEYNGEFPLGQQLESMLIAAFHDNRNVNNRIYGNMASFDTSTFDDLTVGVDIGSKVLNQWDFGSLHNKDVQFSYVENGQRYYVSLLNSMNVHSGSMYYQSNFALVIKETECHEDSVFFTLAENTTTGLVEHAYGEEKAYYASEAEDGYYYKECTECGKTITTGTAHHAGEWTVHLEAQEGKKGIQKQNCPVCGELLGAREYSVIDGKECITSYKQEQGKTFTAEDSSHTRLSVDQTPLTIEAKLHVPKTVSGRGGVIVGNYESVKDNQLNLEIYTEGRVRLYYINGYGYVSCVFDPDIRSDEPVHIAVTADGNQAKLYMNGVLVDTKELSLAMPEKVEGLKIGSDNRAGNPQYFKGTIYSVSLFADVREAEEILRDMVFVSSEEDELLYSTVYSAQDIGDLADVYVFGRGFDETNAVTVESVSSVAPHTIEASVFVPEDLSGRAGVIVGNYDNVNANQFSLEIYNNGQVRLFYMSKYRRFDHVFETDIRTGGFVYLALTVEEDTATLYVDGEKAEQVTLTVPFPVSLSNLRIGGDNRTDNTQYFKGQIAFVHLFSDVRSAEQIVKDKAVVAGTDQGLIASYYLSDDRVINNIADPLGQTFTADSNLAVENCNNAVPVTMEATIQVSPSFSGRGGVIVGNYGNNSPNQMNLEVYEGGRIRLYCLNGWVRAEHIFNTDIRSDDPVHIAVTAYGNTAVLYVNGVETERATLAVEIPTTLTNIRIGGDNRVDNTQYFKGTMYSVSLFRDVRTAEEIQKDSISQVVANDGDVILAGIFVPETTEEPEGKRFSEDTVMELPALNSTPLTVESWLRVPLNQNDRAGVLFGNYTNGAEDQLNVEIYTGGRVRLFYISNGVRFDHIFSTDIRSKEMVHLAVTVNGDIATLYLNGEAVESTKLTVAFASTTDGFNIGGDNRTGNAQYFKGIVYSLALFADARTPEEIAADMLGVSHTADELLYDMTVADEVCPNGNGIEGHSLSDWIVDIAPGEGVHGIYHTECTACGMVTAYKSVSDPERVGETIDYVPLGMSFETHQDILSVEETLAASPVSFEVMFQLSPSFNDRGGVLVGNYTAEGKNVINLEIYNNGLPRFYYRTNHAAYTVQFTTDVRSENKTHLAVTIDGSTANLYVNGALVETATLTAAIPDIREGFCIGGDARTTNYQNFKGTIYSVHLFSDVRTAEEIANDAVMVQCEDDSLIYSTYLAK